MFSLFVRAQLLVQAASIMLALAQFVNTRAAAPSPEMIKKCVSETQRRLESIALQYRINLGAGLFVRIRIAAKQPCFLLHDNAHGSPTIDPDDDIGRQVAYVSADRFFNVSPLNRTFVEGPMKLGNPLPGTLQAELFFNATGLWPFSGLKPVQVFGFPQTLIEVAESPDYIIGDDQYEIEGRACRMIVHRSSRDKLWVDVERGCCLVQRETYDEASGLLMSRCLLTQYREVVPNLWIPFNIHRTDFDSRSAPQPKSQPRVSDITAQLDYVHVNDVTKETFLFVIPAGALELQPNGRVEARQVTPGGIDLLLKQSKWIQARAPHPANLYTQGTWQKNACIAAIVLCVVFIFRISSRSLQRRQSFLS